MNFDEKIMLKCIELAKKGSNTTFPNPMVGSIIINNNKIIGSGFHEKYGDNHAEYNAIMSVKDKSKLKTSTIYVNLEPCSHFNNTPPCADLIIKNKLKKVVIGTIDPFHLVSGNGIKKLKEHCEVVLGVCEKECKELNHRFFIRNTYKRPFIILKWAQSKDGYINDKNYKRGITKISGKKSQDLNHLWRSNEDAIMVGKNTLLYDNPFLTVRNVTGDNPKRIILNKNLDLPRNLNVFNVDNNFIIVSDHSSYNIINNNDNNIILDFNDKNFLLNLMRELLNQKINSIIIEGGTKLISSFIENDLWDEIRFFTSNKELNDGIKAPNHKKIKNMLNYTKNKIGDDNLHITKNLNLLKFFS
tara:strand:- start:1317 stop:2390 length:1074 start_codon:yes stop_codon:yes gene_type:complete